MPPPKAPEEKEYTPAVDPEAFADLFLNISRNRDVIWQQMIQIINHAARGVMFRRRGMAEVKGAALAHVMEIVLDRPPLYDPTRRTAYVYFYQIIKNFMRAEVSRPETTSLGDADVELSFHDLYSIAPQDAARSARENCSHNWLSCRIQNPADRFRVEKRLRVEMRRARQRLRECESRGEKAATLVVIEVIKQHHQTFLG